MGSSSHAGQCVGEDIFFETGKPHFFKVFVDGSLLVPMKFILEHGSAVGNKVTLRGTNGKVWEIGLSKHGDYVCFGKGWPRFVKHYSLAKGDLLLFQYEGGNDFRVMIVTASFCFDKCTPQNHSRTGAPAGGRGVHGTGDHSFSVVMQPSYVGKYANLSVPRLFNNSKSMILEVGDMSWDVFVAKYERKKNIITRGWSTFAMNNSLEVGDCCFFEMLKSKAGVLKVSIHRNVVG